MPVSVFSFAEQLCGSLDITQVLKKTQKLPAYFEDGRGIKQGNSYCDHRPCFCTLSHIDLEISAIRRTRLGHHLSFVLCDSFRSCITTFSISQHQALLLTGRSPATTSSWPRSGPRLLFPVLAGPGVKERPGPVYIPSSPSATERLSSIALHRLPTSGCQRSSPRTLLWKLG